MCLELPARYWNLGDGPLEAHSETILLPRLHPKTTCSSFWHRNFSSGGAAVATLQASRAQIKMRYRILFSPLLQLPGKAPGGSLPRPIYLLKFAKVQSAVPDIAFQPPETLKKKLLPSLIQKRCTNVLR